VSSYAYLYRKCEGNVCPIEGGEAIVKHCACLNDFPAAASLMQVLDNAADDLTCTEYDAGGNCIGDLYIFSGSDRRCRSDGVTIGFDDCCKDEECWFGLGQCKEGERQLATSKAGGLCHYIGEYCPRELDLALDTICIEHSKTYCCFYSKLARIVHEQGRPQLQGDISSWGDVESPNCRGFSPEEFQMLDFARIDLSEWYGRRRIGSSMICRDRWKVFTIGLVISKAHAGVG
jgi:conjugal transfer mating pair stabilization protein TraN